MQPNLDQPAKALWIPQEVLSTRVSGGADQDFESLRSAIFFVMERLSGLERQSAFIQTDELGGHYPIDKIREIYLSLKTQGAQPSIDDEAALPSLPNSDEPYDGSPV